MAIQRVSQTFCTRDMYTISKALFWSDNYNYLDIWNFIVDFVFAGFVGFAVVVVAVAVAEVLAFC